MKFGPIHLDHIGIATHALDDNSAFWSLIGLIQGDEDETVADQGVTTRFSRRRVLLNQHQRPKLSC